MKISEERKSILMYLAMSFLCYLLFIFFDRTMYPDYIVPLLITKGLFLLIFIILFILTKKFKEKNLFIPLLLSGFFVSLGVSIKCIILKEGFGCAYYVGNIIALLGTLIVTRTKTKYYLILISIILLQHFVLLSFIPFEYKDLIKNIFFMAVAASVCILAHYMIEKLTIRIEKLEGFIPICAKCKKIRDDEGYWNQIEKFIEDRSEVEFSHGLCPDCAEKLYGKMEDHDNKTTHHT